MKIDEILYKLVDFVAANQPQTTAAAAPAELAKQPDDIMVPPLQQKMELLKKAVGVENIYDSNQEDELQQLKRAAGVPTAAVMELSNDEPLDD
jgi:hypothetical protein